MRPIISSTNVSLDGLIGDLERWQANYIDDASNRIVSELLFASDALLLGRRTYENFARAWPSGTGDVADKFNSIKKYVASTTLDKADRPNTEIINHDLTGTVAELKKQPGKQILTYGFGPVAQTLLHQGLLDEIRLWIHPVLLGDLGTSDTLFRAGNTARLTLLRTQVLDSGVVILTYRPAGASTAAS